MTREARRVEDPYRGRELLDMAYSMGREAALLGEATRGRAMMVAETQSNRAAVAAMYDQYMMGARHEKETGDAASE